MIKIFTSVLALLLCMSFQNLLCQSTTAPSVIPVSMINEQMDRDGVTITDTTIGPIPGPVTILLPITLLAGGCETLDDLQHITSQHITSVVDSTGASWTEIAQSKIHNPYYSSTNCVSFHLYSASLPNGIPKIWTLTINQDYYPYWMQYSIAAAPIIFTHCDKVDQVRVVEASSNAVVVGPTIITDASEVVAVFPEPIYGASNGYTCAPNWGCGASTITSYPPGTTPEIFSDAIFRNMIGSFVYGDIANGFVSPPGSYTPQYVMSGTDGNTLPVAAVAIHPSPVPPPTMIDPVSKLLGDDSNVPTDPALLASGGREVKGVAADGVAEVVVRVPTPNVGDQVTATLQDYSSSDDDGGLGKPGDSSFTQNQVLITSVSTPKGPMAFAIYRAPIDFVRANFSDSDSQQSSRKEKLQFQNTTENTNASLDIQIVRPPVVFIHGFGDTQMGWSKFAPFFYNGLGNTNPLFIVFAENYGKSIKDLIVSTSPSFELVQSLLPKQWEKPIMASHLGLSYNGHKVLSGVQFDIDGMREGINPLHIPVAAAQADIVGHSMGGLMARQLELEKGYMSPKNFQRGSIHKLITIDTPHLGSQLAMYILGHGSIPETGCVRDLLAAGGTYNFETAQVDGDSGVRTFSGAANDLMGDDSKGFLSPAIQCLNNPSMSGSCSANSSFPPVRYFPIAGNYTNWSAFETSNMSGNVAIICGQLGEDPLGYSFTWSGWQALFSDEPNDAIVSVRSQLNGDTTQGKLFSNFVHSPGTELLGFSGPSVLDSDMIGNQVLQLLNTPVNQFYTITP